MTTDNKPGKEFSSWRIKLHTVIFGTDTRAGRNFDIALLIAVFISVIVVMLESVPSYNHLYKKEFLVFEWSLTIIFSIEYIARIAIVRKPIKYIFSFYGIIDLLSILPSFLGFFITGTGPLRVFRSLRLLRLFKVFHLSQFEHDSRKLTNALKASKNKIIIFLFTIVILVIILGTIMFVVEGDASGFTSIPRSIYWAVVTLTTVGYGDIAPMTPLGQFISSVVMIMGYAIIAVPTGIVTNELLNSNKEAFKSAQCQKCTKSKHEPDAVYCSKCGEKLS